MKSVNLLGAGPPLLVPLELKWDAALDESELTSARSPEVMELPVREGEMSLSMTQRSTTGSSVSWRRNGCIMDFRASFWLSISPGHGLSIERSKEWTHLNNLTVHLPAIFVIHVSNNASDSSAHFLNGADVSAVRRTWLWAGRSDWLPLKIEEIQESALVLPYNCVFFFFATMLN